MGRGEHSGWNLMPTGKPSPAVSEACHTLKTANNKQLSAIKGWIFSLMLKKVGLFYASPQKGLFGNFHMRDSALKTSTLNVLIHISEGNSARSTS